MNTETLKPLSPSERGRLGGRQKGCKGRTLTTEQARATVKARWDKYRAKKGMCMHGNSVTEPCKDCQTANFGAMKHVGDRGL